MSKLTINNQPKYIIVLNYADAKVSVFAPDDGYWNQDDDEFYEEEEVVHLWCEKNGVSFDDIYWMSWSGKIDIDISSKELIALEGIILGQRE
ncbi:MAG: hypothetical protein ACKVN9_03545 [Methylophilaceae bacterium]